MYPNSLSYFTLKHSLGNMTTLLQSNPAHAVPAPFQENAPGETRNHCLVSLNVMTMNLS